MFRSKTLVNMWMIEFWYLLVAISILSGMHVNGSHLGVIVHGVIMAVDRVIVLSSLHWNLLIWCKGVVLSRHHVSRGAFASELHCARILVCCLVFPLFSHLAVH